MSSIDQYFKDWASKVILSSDDAPLIFVSGAQGIGKSTAMNAIANAFDNQIAILGIDDFYLTKAERQALAKDTSPLFETRGPPGTHDLVLLNKKIDELQSTDSASITKIPSFDKITDDRKSEKNDHIFNGKAKAIIVEGWLVGANAEPDSVTESPMNEIENTESALNWRKYQEDQLSGPYAKLWNRSPHFFHLNAPSFETVLNWRIEQEETTRGLHKGELPEEIRDWVRSFILYYERITRRMLDGKKMSGAQLFVDKNRTVIKFEER
ncbi:hypothetical protein [Hirschia baltica]|uniref:Kinase-like protein n=1 Tax=Hirschia baltica (strain ATCC 49814 / DSM 5838 / IFAM 1418) TaxID=582402 RepID=C6XKI8_HIRBI|nr:hypothetical protein [Hirschia baltica]ACT59555.1 conserved hypothetical protein [Hirschia baltica ATCC 49814]